MEQSPYFRLALPMADKLFDSIQGISHLMHMPSHIYIQIGNYKKSL